MKKKAKVLLLCAGPNDRDQSIYKLLVKAGFEVDNFDLVNGDGNDIADKAVFDRICRAVTAKDYVAAFASPDCSTFSKARNMPGGPPPVRGIEGRDRYGLKFYGTRVTSAPKQPLSREDKENVRYHTLVAVRVAFILDLCWTQTIPFGYETPERCAGQVSMLHLDEYIALLARPGVKHKVGFQCPFDGVSAKPTSWVYFGINFDDMPDSCPHTKRLWFNTRDGSAISKRHRPTTGTDTYVEQVLSAHGTPSKPPGIGKQMMNCTERRGKSAALAAVGTSWQPGSPFVSSSLAAYPDLLNRYIAAKIVEATATRKPYYLPWTELAPGDKAQTMVARVAHESSKPPSKLDTGASSSAAPRRWHGTHSRKQFDGRTLWEDKLRPPTKRKRTPWR